MADGWQPLYARRAMTWVPGFTSEETSIEHLDGVAWHEAPIPRRWHHCKPQTRGVMHYFTEVERCTCGAIRLNGDGHWMERNERTR